MQENLQKTVILDVQMKFNLVVCSNLIIEGKNLAPKNSRPWQKNQPCQAAFLNIVNRGSILERTSNI